jgi:FkbM family methyltransferase
MRPKFSDYLAKQDLPADFDQTHVDWSAPSKQARYIVAAKEFEREVNPTKEITSVWYGVNDAVDGCRRQMLWEIWLRVNWFLYLTGKHHDIKKISTIFDVGSLNGIESVFFARLLPWAHAHSFDVSPRATEMIPENQKHRPNAHFHKTAISDTIGPRTFYMPGLNWGASSLLKPSGGYAGNPDECTKIEVPCTTIEAFCRESGIGAVNLLWMDLQGNELAALRGMGHMLDGVVAIHSEVGLKPCYEGHQLYPEINAFLEEHGFARDTTECPFYHNCGEYEDDMIYVRRN